MLQTLSIVCLQLNAAELTVEACNHWKRHSAGGSCVVRCLQTHDKGGGRTGPPAECTRRSVAESSGVLVGATMRLPHGFEGFVLRKPRADANAARTWKTDACISELT